MPIIVGISVYIVVKFIYDIYIIYIFYFSVHSESEKPFSGISRHWLIRYLEILIKIVILQNFCLLHFLAILITVSCCFENSRFFIIFLVSWAYRAVTWCLVWLCKLCFLSWRLQPIRPIHSRPWTSFGVIIIHVIMSKYLYFNKIC